MFLPEVAFYATNNPNHVFFLIFFLSILKVCFHTILNKSNNIVVLTSTSPPLALYLPLIDFGPQSLVIPPRYQAAVFSLADASSIVLYNSFRKHSAIIFQYYTEEPRLATTPFIRLPLASAYLP